MSYPTYMNDADFTMEQFQKEAQNTKSTLMFDLAGQQYDYEPEPDAAMYNDILHAAIGIATEAGELLDPFKKCMFYGKPLDFVNLDEEVGDILWYIAIYAEARGTSILALAERNNRKLKVRYPEKFSTEKAVKRNLGEERQALEDF
jgi:NTP pyrophosphatase (non-canonical NTP hydrolase)